MSKERESLIKLITHEAYPALSFALFFSLIINLLMLTVPLYMLQVFDRVLTSQSIETLTYLTVIAIFALIIMTLLDISRSRILLRVGQWFDRKLGGESLSRSIDNKLRGGNYSQQCLADVNSIRQFFSGSSVFAFFDAPWVIIYILIIYFLSVPLGVIATVGAVVLAILAYFNESISRNPNKQSNDLYAGNTSLVGAMLQNSETLRAMGMQTAFVDRWFSGNEQFLDVQKGVIQRSNIIIAAAKLIRLILQILILCMGAYYVIKSELTPGGMIAASIIMARGLAPIEQGMTAWKSMLDSLGAYGRLKDYLKTSHKERVTTTPQFEGVIQVEDISLTVAERSEPILQNIKFTLTQGKQLAIIGPVAAGKSSLARVLVGISKPSYGNVRIDSSDIYLLDDEKRRNHIGYLSQTDSLLPGTVRDNIDRLSNGDDQAVTAAADLVNIHQLIQHLAENYATRVEGYNLSVGQRQRVGLARAFYNNPCFVVLDEPEANLDGDGITSLLNTLQQVRQHNTTVIYVTQNPLLARSADFALVLKDGRMQEYGPAAKIVDTWMGAR
jgi:ATP-binding cassette subfamily C exporter for protease/lipase